MPLKLKPHEYGDPDSRSPYCREARCQRHVIRCASGHELAFCLEHAEMLTRGLFDDLCAAATASPFDLSGVAEAARVVDRCLLRIARVQATRKARRAPLRSFINRR